MCTLRAARTRTQCRVSTTDMLEIWPRPQRPSKSPVARYINAASARAHSVLAAFGIGNFPSCAHTIDPKVVANSRALLAPLAHRDQEKKRMERKTTAFQIPEATAVGQLMCSDAATVHSGWCRAGLQSTACSAHMYMHGIVCTYSTP